MKPWVVQLFAAPSAGKSTLAAGLLFKLKNNEMINAELTGESAKDYVYERRQKALSSQLYVFAEQQFRIERLYEDVDVIISDSPVLLSTLYAKNMPESFNELVKYYNSTYNAINVLVNRVKPFHQSGRIHNEVQAEKIQKQVKQLLDQNKLDYIEVNGDESGLDIIVEEIKRKMKETN